MKKLLVLITLSTVLTGCAQAELPKVEQIIDQDVVLNNQKPQEQEPEIVEPEPVVETFLKYEDFTEQQIIDIKQRFWTIGQYFPMNSTVDTDFKNAMHTYKDQNGSTVTEEDLIEQSILTAFYETTDLNFANPEHGYLMLSNKEKALPFDYQPAETRVVKVFSNKTIYTETQTAQATEDMFAKAKQDGVNLMLVSGFRDFSYQQGLFDRKVAAVGFITANQVVAIPGQSEHQTGFVIDISSNSVGGSLVEKFDQTNEFKWLIENCADFGFILRYGKDQTAITGYTYEPWHYRYVGDPVIAHEIMDNNWTLEEYHQNVEINPNT